MNKAINIENSSKNIVRVLSIANETVIENNPTGLEYILINDFTEPPDLQNNLSINYSMYDKANEIFIWKQIQYQNTATEEVLNIENIKMTLSITRSELATTNSNIDMLIELQADILGGAI